MLCPASCAWLIDRPSTASPVALGAPHAPQTVLRYVRCSSLATLVLYGTDPLRRYLCDHLLGGLSDRWLFVALTLLAHETMYFGINSFFLLCDRKGYFKKHKLPRKKMQEPSDKVWMREKRERRK